MIATKPVDLRARLKDYLDRAFSGEPVIVSRKNNQNVVIVSEHEYNELQKAKRNFEYLAMLDESRAQLERGETISFSMEELKEMEAEGWKPTPKVLDWMRRTDEANRLVYDIDELQNIKIISCKGHYED